MQNHTTNPLTIINAKGMQSLESQREEVSVTIPARKECAIDILFKRTNHQKWDLKTTREFILSHLQFTWRDDNGNANGVIESSGNANSVIDAEREHDAEHSQKAFRSGNIVYPLVFSTATEVDRQRTMYGVGLLDPSFIVNDNLRRAHTCSTYRITCHIDGVKSYGIEVAREERVDDCVTRNSDSMRRNSDGMRRDVLEVGKWHKVEASVEGLLDQELSPRHFRMNADLWEIRTDASSNEPTNPISPVVSGQRHPIGDHSTFSHSNSAHSNSSHRETVVLLRGCTQSSRPYSNEKPLLTFHFKPLRPCQLVIRLSSSDDGKLNRGKTNLTFANQEVVINCGE